MPKYTIAELYEVADDYQANVLDELRIKAGHTWDCDGGGDSPHWTNTAEDAYCQECSRRRPTKED